MKIKNVANTKNSQISTPPDNADRTVDRVAIAHTQ